MLFIPAEIGRPDPGAQAPAKERDYVMFPSVFTSLQATTIPTCSAIVPGYIVFSIFYQSYLDITTLCRQA